MLHQTLRVKKMQDQTYLQPLEAARVRNRVHLIQAKPAQGRLWRPPECRWELESNVPRALTAVLAITITIGHKRWKRIPFAVNKRTSWWRADFSRANENRGSEIFDAV